MLPPLGALLPAIVELRIVRVPPDAMMVSRPPPVAGLGPLVTSNFVTLPAPAPEVRVCEELEPGTKRRKLAKALTRLDGNTVALVGHEPDLSTFAAWLLGDRKIHLELAKAGVAYLRCADKPDRRSAALHWLVTVDWLGG